MTARITLQIRQSDLFTIQTEKSSWKIKKFISGPRSASCSCSSCTAADSCWRRSLWSSWRPWYTLPHPTPTFPGPPCWRCQCTAWLCTFALRISMDTRTLAWQSMEVYRRYKLKTEFFLKTLIKSTIFLVVFCVASFSSLDGRGLGKSASTSQVN